MTPIHPATKKTLLTYGSASTALMAAKSLTLNAAVLTHSFEDLQVSGVTYFSIDSFAEDASSITVNSANSSTDHFWINPSTNQTSVGAATSNGITFGLIASINSGYPVRHYSAGDSIDGNLASGFSFHTVAGLTSYYVKYGGAMSDSWTADTKGYAGFRISISGRTHYGWLELSAAGPGTDSATFHRFGIETSADTPALITAVPEPAHTAALFAAGAVGVATLRRRRKNKAF